MNKIKKEIKLLYTFIIIFIICTFLLVFNTIFIISKSFQNKEIKNFETISKSVVSVHTYVGYTKSMQGSGFIYKVDKDKAYILTNNHVVENGTSAKVYLSEDEYVNAKILGYDKYLDVAVLSIKNKGYTSLKLDQSNNLNIGDVVYTIGTPFNNEFFNSAASGIISKTSRMRIENNANENILMNMIQTDIITNPGNSGGPLLNSKLEVIGICTTTIETDGLSGISFAVPITQIIKKLDELEKEGEILERKISNLKITNIKDSETLYKNNLIELTQEPNGVVILEEDKETSLKKGDIIIKIDDNEIKDIYYYNYYLNQYSKNEKVKITIKRNNKEKTINVKIK